MKEKKEYIDEKKINFIVKRPILMSMIFLAFTVAGLFSLLTMKINLLPTVHLPIIQVTVTNPGMSAEDIENLITKKLERVFTDLGAIKKLKSYSAEGVCNIILEFEYGKRDIDEAAIEVQRKINEIRNELPPTIDEPIIRKVDPTTRPIMSIAFYSKTMDLRDLREYAENYLKRRFELIPNVARVIVNGGYVRQINIFVNRYKLEQFNIPFSVIYQVLKANNANIPGGDIDYENFKISVRSMGQFKTIDDIKNTVITNIDGRDIKIKDVATVVDSYKQPRGYASVNGIPAVSFEIKKETGSNTVEVAKAVRKLVEKLNKELPAGSHLVVVRDDSEFIREAIKNIVDAAWQGFLLAFFAVLLILGQVKPSMIIFISVPISIISTFLVIHFAHLDISMVVLYALTLSIGVNFDASVVILESIFRHMQEGKDRLIAATESIKELWAPLLASTLTNVIVFIPLTQLKGYIGELMRAMALSAISAQVMALPVALMFTSTITPRIITHYEDKVSNFLGLGFIFKATTGFVKWLSEKYEKIMRIVLDHKFATLTVTIILLLASIGLVPFIGIEFMPRVDQNEYFLEIETPEDSTLEYTIKVVNEVEKILKEQKELKYSIVNIGGDNPDSPPVNKATFSLKFIPLRERKRKAVDSGDPKTDIISFLRQEIKRRVPGIKYMQFVQPAPWWGSAGAPVEINLFGIDWDLLNKTADKYVKVLKNLPGIFDVQKNTRMGKLEYRVHFDQTKLSELGLTVGEVSNYLRNAIHGGDVARIRTEYRVGGFFRDKDIYIVTRFDKNYRKNLEDIKNIPIVGKNGVTVKLSQVATFELKRGINFITKENKLRRITVLVQTSNEPLNVLVFKRILPALKKVKVPQGIKVTMSGEVTRMNDQFVGMTIGFLIAFIFVFMVLAGQFESFKQPILMLAAVPVMFIGIFVIMFLTGTTLNTTSGNGIFALLGVVVNTSVILIDYINLLRKRGMPLREAIIRAGKVRLRPILMTVSTTFFAMIPMALSYAEGSGMYKPLAIAFIGGLTTSTILTLVIIPVLYELAEKERK